MVGMKLQQLRKGGSLRKNQSERSKKSKQKNKKQRQPFVFSRAATKATALIGLVVLSAGLALWWQFIFTDSEQVFKGMVNQTLKTSSVTRSVVQDSGAQTLSQINRLQFGADPAVIGETTISQTGETTAEVITEEIGIPDRDYVRYQSIQTSQRDSDGEAIDFEDVIGIWGVSDSAPGQPGESFGEAVFGIIPFANLSTSERRELVSLALESNVYDVDYLGVTKDFEDGRMIYTYPVSLQPQAYIAYLQQVASAIGLTQLESVNPADFQGVNPIRFTVKVDMLTRQPVEVDYGMQAQRSETLQSHGVIQSLSLPTDPIPAVELQQRIQSLQ